MLKRVMAIALVAIMLVAMTIVAVSAAEVSDPAGADTSSSASGADSKIYFNAAGWKNFKDIYCHIWVIGGNSFYGWQTGGEKCTKVSGTTYSYDVSVLKSDDSNMPEGLQSGKDYGIIFSADTGSQTYDSTFGTACVGDTAALTGEQIENPVDSEKSADEIEWEKNGSKYGSHLAITSIGNIVGSVLGPNESNIQVIGDWIPSYYLSGDVNAVDALAKAYPKFGITDIDQVTKIYAYVKSKETGEDEKEILKQLEEAFAKAYPDKKDQKVDEKAAEQIAEKIEEGGTDVSELDNASVEDAASGNASGDSSDGSSNYSGSASDGQETTIFFVLAIVMMAAAGVVFFARKRRED